MTMNSVQILDGTLPEEIKGTHVRPGNHTTAGVSTEVEPESKAGTKGKTDVAAEGGNKQSQPGEAKMADSLNKDDILNDVKAMLEQEKAQEAIASKIADLEAEKATLIANAQEQADQAKVDLDAAKAELTSIQEQLEVAKKDLEDAKAEVETAKSEVETAKAEAVEAVTAKEEAEKAAAAVTLERLTEKRRNEMAEAGLLSDNEEASSKQVAKAAAMDEEAYAEYVEELKAVASKAVASVAQAPPPADVDHTAGDVFRMSVASSGEAVSLEDDMVSKYAQM